MGFFDKYTKVDRVLMEDGAEIDFGDDFFVTIRHVSSKKVDAERAKKLQQLRVGNRNRELTSDQQKELMHHVTAHAGIVGWRGGDAPTYSPEFALQLFEERPEFLEDVMTAMTSYEAFRQEVIEETSGNSSQSSNGDSSGENTSKRSSSTKVKVDE